MLSMLIPLTQGKVAIIGASDYDRVRQFKWYAHRGYAIRTSPSPDRRTIYMHRVVLNVPPGFEIDHINGDRSDNRRQNLRIATHAENNRNRHPNKATGYVGVTWFKRTQRWRAEIKLSRKNRHIGYFATAEEAARARDAVARDLHGPFAFLNFPDHETALQME